MNKRQFIAPYIMLSAGSGGNGGDSGYGSVHGGQGGNLANPMNYEAWRASKYAEDLIENGTIDFNDYAAWWGTMVELNPEAFTRTLWESWGYTWDEDWDP